MGNIVIKAENITKVYQLGQIGGGSISRDFESWRAKLAGKSNPYSRISEEKGKTSGNGLFWALKDINFEIEQGETVGLIGTNGAGKSTLLKIISRITAPTSGKIKGKGRITSLLEIGTGFHPELTGRENVFLNGAMLGMQRSEVKRKFDQIIDFAEIEKHIQTPVKRYSSGMYMRLAFSVAAHLESELLIMDEVLAVGDKIFQQKCIDKVQQISKEEGKTILMVSHNLNESDRLFSKKIVLTNGSILNS
nr:ABC transporter ATP-binding protein [Pedobacter panaciterrae]